MREKTHQRKKCAKMETTTVRRKTHQRKKWAKNNTTTAENNYKIKWPMDRKKQKKDATEETISQMHKKGPEKQQDNAKRPLEEHSD